MVPPSAAEIVRRTTLVIESIPYRGQISDAHPVCLITLDEEGFPSSR